MMLMHCYQNIDYSKKRKEKEDKIYIFYYETYTGSSLVTESAASQLKTPVSAGLFPSI